MKAAQYAGIPGVMELLADEKDGRYKRLQRRHIYLHRLAGDDIFAAKVEAQPKAPMRMVPGDERLSPV